MSCICVLSVVDLEQERRIINDINTCDGDGAVFVVVDLQWRLARIFFA